MSIRAQERLAYAGMPNLRVSASNGVDYAYRDTSPESESGTPLVLLQRFRGNLDNWDPALIDALASNGRVLTFDNAGVGGSTGDTPDTIEQMAHDAIAFIDALELESVDLLGFSIGSFVAQQIALTRPALVRRLILASSAPQGAAGMHGWAPEVIGAVGNPQTKPEQYLDVFFTRSAASRQAGQENLRRMSARTQDRDEITTWATRQAQYDAVCTWGIPDHGLLQRLSCLAMPVFVANGDSDPMIMPRYSYLLAGLIPQARLKIYPDSAHGFLFQHYAEFARDVDAFLTTTSLCQDDDNQESQRLRERPASRFKENTMSDPLTVALQGHEPGALAENVSLATPLTSSPLTGRDAVVAALRAYADVIGETDADLRLKGEELEGAVFTTAIDGHTAQIAALVTRNGAGLIATIHIYGRPWPYMALIRERLAEVDPSLADPEIGTSAPEGPGTSWTDPPAVPQLADDVTLFSPVLTGNPSGKAVVGRILTAAFQSLTDPRFRAVLRIEGHEGFAAVLDAVVEGNVSQIIQMFTLNTHGEVAEIRIFTRPWPVTADLRNGIHEHLGDLLGPEFWGDPRQGAAVPSHGSGRTAI